MSELVYISIITGIFTLLAIGGLALSYRYKLKLTLDANDWERQRIIEQRKSDVKLAKIRHPNYRGPGSRRMPKNFKDQILEWIELMGDERVQGIMEFLSEHSDAETGDNKIIDTFVSLAGPFLEGMAENAPELEEGEGHPQNY